MPVSEAAALLGQAGTSALRKRLMAGTVRGLPPYSDGNPTREWVVSRAQIETEAANRGRRNPVADGQATTLADLRLEMLQAALGEEKDRRIADLEQRIADVIAERDSRLAERDVRIAQLERQVAALGRSLAEVTAAPLP
jgi:uncharacterized coiled-coil protein SlyX